MRAKPQVSTGNFTDSLGVGMNPTAPRALSAIRLSVLTDETTSPERQRTANHAAAASIGAQIIGEAVDLGVSASKTTPFERPELGSWLSRPDEFDVIVFWRLDRAVRSMADMSALIGWARKHGKRLLFAEGPGGARLELDMSSVVGELIATLMAFAAQMEAESIKERVAGAQSALRTMPLRWRGSRAPYGYLPAPLDGGGWTLIPDPEAVKVIERVITALVNGSTVNSIVYALNKDGVSSPTDRWSEHKGREIETPTRWNSVTLARILRSETLIGWKMASGKPVRDSEGRPVMATREPILTRAEFDSVQALLEERSINNAVRRDTNALLFGVAHCDSCGGRLYFNRQEGKPGQRPTYRCGASARGEVCEHPVNIRADWIEEYVENEFLRMTGGFKVTRTIHHPGYDPAPEIAATLAEYEAHQEQQGQQRSSAAKAAWQKRADALDARLAELEETPVIPARVEYIDTGRRMADEWWGEDTAGRRAMLTDAGAYLAVKPGRAGGWRSLDTSRVAFTLRDGEYAEGADYESANHADAL
ncbi:recombinase family protein [Streptomyces sp. H28]|uniref:recombinase family protein n=1 Tax=Streptomyces sp. H28 TaxID=2775865 RepID=UPI001CE1C504|nr:recombinase family protein [Streptomyces sp. H28]